MTFDLQEALLTAADKAGKMQAEFQQQIDDLLYRINCIEGENTRLREKLSKVAELMKQFAEILVDDQKY